MSKQMAQCLDLNGMRFNLVRQHDLDGRLYTFEPGKPTPVPFAVAVKHLVPNKTFEVRDPDGNVIKAQRNEDTDVPGSAPVVLKADETIARFEELTADALRKRALEFGDFDQAGYEKKEDMISFLTAKAAGTEPKLPEGESDGSAAETELEHND